MFVIAELAFGYAANSLALISDAVHNFSDVIALLLAWGAAWLARRQPTQQHTYGYRRASILAALFNAGLLLVAVGGIAVEAINRIQEPAAVAGWTVVLVAALGILINGATALLFMRGRHSDLNIRGAYLHMAADAGVSFGVVVAALLIMGPAGSGSIRRSACALRRLCWRAAGAWPKTASISRSTACRKGLSWPRWRHIWRPGRRDRVARPAHLGDEHQRDRADGASGVPGGYDDSFLHQVCEELSRRFNIHHATLQIEASSEVCKLAPAEVV